MASSRASEHPRRLRYVPLAAAAAVVLVVGGAWGLVGSAPRGAGAPVLAAVPYVANTFEPPPTYVTVPDAFDDLAPCAPGQLTLERTETPEGPAPEPGLGQSAYFLEFRNQGASCSLTGGPEVALMATSGTAAPLTARKSSQTASSAGGETVPQLPMTWRLEAAQRVDLTVIFSGSSCGHFTGDTVEVVITDVTAGIMRVELPEPNCEPGGIAGDILDSTVWTPHFPKTPFDDLPIPFQGSGIIATIDAPETVPVGGQIIYTVTLSNPTELPVSLDPCPSYRQAAGEGGTGAEEYGLLNCADAPPSIAANGAVTFEMRIDVPIEFDADARGTLHWASYPEGVLGDATTFIVQD